MANKDKKHLFFFWSQEYTGQFVPGGTQTTYMPTALERIGNFSQTCSPTTVTGIAMFEPILESGQSNPTVLRRSPATSFRRSRINPRRSERC